MTSADLPRYVNIAVAPLRVQPVLLGRKAKEPFHSLAGQISGFAGILSASHFSLTLHSSGSPDIKPISICRTISDAMPSNTASIEVDSDMEQYIKSRSSDQRIATTCEGPLIFSIKTSPPKPTDQVIAVGERRVYISAIQAPHIKSINSRMLPRCALEKRR